MKLRWPWRRHRAPGNGHAAAEAKTEAMKRLAEQQQKWPEVFEARDAFTRLAERSMRRPS